MIVFDLKCRKDHRFEAWFPDSAAYERQVKAKKVACPECGATKIAKAPMAPALKRSESDIRAAAEARKMLVKMREQVEKNCDYVGPQFAEEARRIHHGETDARNIYGEATAEESKALREEGVDFGEVPWIPRGDA
ncbi:MAG: DUF1178 family protein [Alphaproteobacteria bacterium]|nr:DUF1178 family protein [Alphaproteobacteria bacterium]